MQPYHVYFFRAPAFPGFFLSLIRGSLVSRPAINKQHTIVQLVTPLDYSILKAVYGDDQISL